MKKRHIDRLREGRCTIELGFILSDLTTSYKRIADDCSSIAVCLIQSFPRMTSMSGTPDPNSR